MGDFKVFDQLEDKTGRVLGRSDHVDAVFGSGHGHIEKASFFREGYGVVGVGHQLHDGVVFDLCREAEAGFQHVEEDDVVEAQAFGSVGGEEGDVGFREFSGLKFIAA